MTRRGRTSGVVDADAGALYVALLEQAQDALLVVDATTGQFVIANGAAERLLGYSRDELVQRRPSDLIEPSLAETLQAALDELTNAGTWAGEWQVRPRNGRVITVEIHASMVRVNGRVLYQALLHDTTERRRIEQALRESESRLRTLVSNLPLVLFVVDADGRLETMEGSGLLPTRIDGQQLVGMSIFELCHEIPEAAACIRRALDGEACTATIQFRNRTFEATYEPIRDSTGSVTGVVGAAADITERYRAECELRVRNRRSRGVAELGRWALAGAAPSVLTTSAVHLIARELDVQHVMLEMIGEDHRTRLVGGFGWRDGVLDTERAIEPGTPWDSLAVRVARPLMVSDWAEETRYAEPSLLREHGVVSSLLVACHCAGDGRVSGILSAHDTRPREFTPADGLFMETMAALLADAIARRTAEDEARRTAAEFKTIVEHGHDMVVRFDPGLRCVYANPTTEALTGRGQDQLVGKTLRQMGLPEAEASLFELILRRASRSGQEQTIEHILTTASGPQPCVTRVVPESARHGSTRSLLAISCVAAGPQQIAGLGGVLHSILEGQLRIDALLSELVARDQERSPAAAASVQLLTKRELQVLRLVGLGFSNREIALELNLRTGTVKNHVASIFSKLNLNSRVRAAMQAAELGLVEPTESGPVSARLTLLAAQGER